MLEITTPLVVVDGIRTHLGKVIPIKPIDNKYLLIQASYLLKFLETCKLTSHSMRFCLDSLMLWAWHFLPYALLF